MQMGSRPSKDGNDVMSMHTLSETDSDYIRQAKLKTNMEQSENAQNHVENIGVFTSSFGLHSKSFHVTLLAIC